MLAPARAGAAHDPFRSSRHVVLQPEEHRLAGRHLHRRAIRRGARERHAHELPVPPFADPAPPPPPEASPVQCPTPGPIPPPHPPPPPPLLPPALAPFARAPAH